MAFYKPCRSNLVLSKAVLSAGIDKRPVRGPQAHDDVHRFATGRAQGDERFWGYDLNGLANVGVGLHEHRAEGVGRDGTAGVEKAEVANLPEAIGQDVLEEAAHKLQDIERSCPRSSASGFAIGKGDGTLLERDNASVGEGNPEDIGGKVGKGRVAIWMGLRMDIPRDVPSLWVDVFQQSGLSDVIFEEGTVDG